MPAQAVRGTADAGSAVVRSRCQRTPRGDKLGSMAIARVVLTYEDYAALPADGRRYELHAGGLSVRPAPGSRHQEVSAHLFVVLYLHVKAERLGKVLAAPIDVILDQTTVVQPDIVFVVGQRLSIVSARGIEGPPSLAVEILSPSTLRIDRSVKLQLYAQHGVPHYWIVDPDARTIEAYALREGAFELVGRAAGGQPASLPPFPDLALAPASLWA
jgi:Uma2 family endonuclease